MTSGMSSGLQRRLLLLLLLPLLLLAMLNTWFDFRSAASAALEQDRQLLNLAPLLADSVIAGGGTPDEFAAAAALEQVIVNGTVKGVIPAHAIDEVNIGRIQGITTSRTEQALNATEVVTHRTQHA